MGVQRWCVRALLCWGLWWSAAHARAQDESSQGYQALIDEGVLEFGAGNYVEARSLFERAHALAPNARTLRALGLCAFELKHYVQALDELQAALSDTRNPLTAELAQGVQRTLERARGFVGELRLRTDPADSRLLIDGQEREGRVFRLDVGEHLLTASAPGYHSRDLRLSISGLQTQRIELVLTPLTSDVLQPAAAARTLETQPLAGPTAAEPLHDTSALTERWWFWSALGVVVVGAAVAVVVVATRQPDRAPESSSGVTLHAL